MASVGSTENKTTFVHCRLNDVFHPPLTPTKRLQPSAAKWDHEPPRLKRGR
jgi:hypothetical protein